MIRHMILGAASCLALAMPAMAYAQDAAAPVADEQAGLGDIIVQARKIDENLQDVPIAVTAFSGEDLIAQNVQQAQDLARFTPGFALRPGSSTPSAMTLNVRGQVQTDILATLDPSVGTYVDGVYWARAYGLNSDLLDVASVQVLKGPQGTLFGRNTTGGALVINSADPELGELSGRLSLTYGRFNEMTATGVLNVPVGDSIAVRAAVQRSTRDGYTRNTVNGLAYDNRDRWNARLKVLIQPTDTFSLQLSGEFFDMDERTPARELTLATSAYTAANSTYNTASTSGLYVGLITGNPFATATAAGLTTLNNQAAFLAANPRVTSNDVDSYALARSYTFGATAALETDWGEIRLIGSYRQTNSLAGVDLEGSSFNIHFTEGEQRLRQWSTELQITGQAFNDSVDFVFGAFAFHEWGFDRSISITVPVLNPLTSRFFGRIDNDSVGVYGQATWRITDRLSFTGGLRYSVDDKGLTTFNNNHHRTNNVVICSLFPTVIVPGNALAPDACSITRRDNFEAISYLASLDYRVTDDVLVYIRTSRGFRSGGQNLRAPTPAAFQPFAPEIAYSHEIGVKSEFFDRRLRVNLAAFRTDVLDIQRSTLIATGGGGSATILGNAGKARFTGFEAELQALLFEGFRLSMSGSLVDPEYIRYADLSGDRSFEPFGVPETSFTIAGDYEREIGNATVRLRVDYSWLDDYGTSYNYVANPQNAAIQAATTTPSAGLLGARASIGFADNAYELAVWGRNITNNRDYINNLLVAPLGYVSGVRREPATYGVTATVRF